MFINISPLYTRTEQKAYFTQTAALSSYQVNRMPGTRITTKDQRLANCVIAN